MLIHVSVTAGAKKEKFEQIDDKKFEISVREKAGRNQANVRVLELLRNHYGNPEGGVLIVTGHKSPKKLISVGKE